MFKAISFIIFIFLLLPTITHAAVLYFEPGDGAFGPGDNFAVDIKIDINTGCVNTIEGSIKFPSNQVMLEDFLVGESILSIWVEKPSRSDMKQVNANEELYFAGGIPGGYCGKIPGDPGESNIIGKMIFRVPAFTVSGEESGPVDIYWADKTRALLNDGLGTEDELILKGASFKLLDKAVAPDVDWNRLIARDVIPPEPFIIEVHQRDDIFEGAYYLIFSTTDKQTGVDRYEILEIKPGDEVGVSSEQTFWQKLFGRKAPVSEWIVANMPYKLSDQSLGSIIKVKAVDKAGNERTVEYIPPSSARPEEKGLTSQMIILLSVAGVAFVSVLIILIIIHRRKKHEEV